MSQPESRIEKYRESLKHSLNARFVLRGHVTLIIFATSLVTWLVDFILLKLGMISMLARYPLAILAGYGAFLLCVKMWLNYSGIQEYLNQRDAEALVNARRDNPSNSGSWDVSGLDLIPSGDGEGCLVVIAVAVIGFILFWGLGAFATQLFADVVLEVILAAGLLKGLRKAESSGWLTGAWGSTKYWLLLMIIVAIGFGAWAHNHYPNAHTALQVYQEHYAKPNRTPE